MPDILKFIFKPSFWIMNCKYNDKWDKAVNKALDTGEIIYVSNCKSVVGGISIWTENYPYGYGTPYNADLSDAVRPSRETIVRLRKALPFVNEDKGIDDKVEEWINE